MTRPEHDPRSQAQIPPSPGYLPELLRAAARVREISDRALQEFNGLVRSLEEARTRETRLMNELREARENAQSVARRLEESDRRTRDWEARHAELSRKLAQDRTALLDAILVKLGESRLLSHANQLAERFDQEPQTGFAGAAQVTPRTVQQDLEKWLFRMTGHKPTRIFAEREVTVSPTQTQGLCEFNPQSPWADGIVLARCRVVLPGWKINELVVELARLDVVEVFRPHVEEPRANSDAEVIDIAEDDQVEERDALALPRAVELGLEISKQESISKIGLVRESEAEAKLGALPVGDESILVSGPSDPAQKGIAPDASDPAQTGIALGASDPAQKGIAPGANDPVQKGIAPGPSHPVRKRIEPGMSEPAQKGTAPGASDPAQKRIAPSMSDTAQKGIAPVMSDPAQKGVAPGVSESEQKGVAPGAHEPEQKGIASGANDSMPSGSAASTIDLTPARIRAYRSSVEIRAKAKKLNLQEDQKKVVSLLIEACETDQNGKGNEALSRLRKDKTSMEGKQFFEVLSRTYGELNAHNTLDELLGPDSPERRHIESFWEQNYQTHQAKQGRRSAQK